MASILVAQKGGVNQTANRFGTLGVQVVLQMNGKPLTNNDGAQIRQNLRFRLIDASEESLDAAALIRSVGDRRSLELLPWTQLTSPT